MGFGKRKRRIIALLLMEMIMLCSISFPLRAQAADASEPITVACWSDRYDSVLYLPFLEEEGTLYIRRSDFLLLSGYEEWEEGPGFPPLKYQWLPESYRVINGEIYDALFPLADKLQMQVYESDGCLYFLSPTFNTREVLLLTANILDLGRELEEISVPSSRVGLSYVYHALTEGQIVSMVSGKYEEDLFMAGLRGIMREEKAATGFSNLQGEYLEASQAHTMEYRLSWLEEKVPSGIREQVISEEDWFLAKEGARLYDRIVEQIDIEPAVWYRLLSEMYAASEYVNAPLFCLQEICRQADELSLNSDEKKILAWIKEVCALAESDEQDKSRYLLETAAREIIYKTADDLAQDTLYGETASFVGKLDSLFQNIPQIASLDAEEVFDAYDRMNALAFRCLQKACEEGNLRAAKYLGIFYYRTLALAADQLLQVEGLGSQTMVYAYDWQWDSNSRERILRSTLDEELVTGPVRNTAVSLQKLKARTEPVTDLASLPFRIATISARGKESPVETEWMRAEEEEQRDILWQVQKWYGVRTFYGKTVSLRAGDGVLAAFPVTLSGQQLYIVLHQKKNSLWQDVYIKNLDIRDNRYTAISSDEVLRADREGAIYRLYGSGDGIFLSVFGTEEEAFACQVMGTTGYGHLWKEPGMPPAYSQAIDSYGVLRGELLFSGTVRFENMNITREGK